MKAVVIALSVDLVALEAYQPGLRSGGRAVSLSFSTSLSKPLVMMGVSGPGLSAFRVLMLLCLGTGMIVADMRRAETLACVRNRLELSVISVSVVSKLEKKMMERAPLPRMHCWQWVSGRRAST